MPSEETQKRAVKRYGSIEEIERDMFPALHRAKRRLIERHPRELEELHSEEIRKGADSVH